MYEWLELAGNLYANLAISRTKVGKVIWGYSEVILNTCSTADCQNKTTERLAMVT